MVHILVDYWATGISYQGLGIASPGVFYMNPQGTMCNLVVIIWCNSSCHKGFNLMGQEGCFFASLQVLCLIHRSNQCNRLVIILGLLL